MLVLDAFRLCSHHRSPFQAAASPFPRNASGRSQLSNFYSRTQLQAVPVNVHEHVALLLHCPVQYSTYWTVVRISSTASVTQRNVDYCAQSSPSISLDPDCVTSRYYQYGNFISVLTSECSSYFLRSATTVHSTRRDSAQIDFRLR